MAQPWKPLQIRLVRHAVVAAIYGEAMPGGVVLDGVADEGGLASLFSWLRGRRGGIQLAGTGGGG